MSLIASAPLVLTVLLSALAVYHLVMGAVALLAPRGAARIVGALYGASLGDSPQLRYVTSMVGALALAVGVATLAAARDPIRLRAVLVALLVLQLARLFCRLRDRRLLAAAFGVTAGRNAMAAALLGLEIAILSLALR